MLSQDLGKFLQKEVPFNFIIKIVIALGFLETVKMPPNTVIFITKRTQKTFKDIKVKLF